MIDFSIYKNKKVLITGSTGFKGSWLAYILYVLGAKVIGSSLKPDIDSVVFRSLKIEKKIKQYYVDINDYKKLNKIILKENPEIIFHLAAQSIVSDSIDNPLNTIETNILGSANVLSSFKNSNSKVLVYCTSDKCYQNNEWIWGYRENDIMGGKDPYSASKACAEIIFNSYNKTFFIKNNKQKLATVRAGNVIGGGDFKKDRLIPDIIKSLYANKTLKIKNPKSIRPWQHVLEPLSGYLLVGKKLLSSKKNYEIPNWNFGPNVDRFYTVKYILNEIQKLNNLKFKIIYLNFNKTKYESKYLLLNSDKAKLELGWKPKLDIKQTIKMTLDWYNEYYKNKKNIENFTQNQIINFFNIK